MKPACLAHTARCPPSPWMTCSGLVIEEDASDLHLSVGVPPTLRLKGLLTPLNPRP